MSITPDTVLHRTPDVVIQLDGSNNARVLHQGKAVRLGHEALALIDLCHTPRTVTELVALATGRHPGARRVADLLSTLSRLVTAGVLRTEPAVGFSTANWPDGGYDAAFVHITILDDIARKSAFVRAVRDTVRPGDVVLDLGTGSGILAVTAARAGARRVYAVEPAGMVGLAGAVAERNGVADVITFVRGWSTEVDLPERADVLTTDIVGNEALDMMIWETVADARARHLRPGARLVPTGFTAMARLIDIPYRAASRHRVDAAHLERWQRAYGIDFAPLRDTDTRGAVGFYERPEVVNRWPVRSKPVPLYDVDLHDDIGDLRSERALVADGDGRVSGVAVYFEARLSPATRFSSAPWSGGETSHWYSAVWALPEPLDCRTGDEVRIGYAYRGDGSSAVELLDVATGVRSAS